MTYTDYDPAALAVQLAGGFAAIAPWVGAGVGAGVVLLFAFLGIRKGFEFFNDVAENRGLARSEDRWLGDVGEAMAMGYSESAAMQYADKEQWGRDFSEFRAAGKSFEDATSAADDRWEVRHS